MSPAADVVVRDATPRDAAAIAEMIVEVADEATSYAFPEPLPDDPVGALWTEVAPGRVVVAEVDGRVVGTAKMGPNRPGRGSHVATASFLVARTGRRTGVGLELVSHVVTWARSAGYQGIQFNAVVSTNTAAVALWERVGFRVVGRVPGAFRHPTQGDVDLLVMYLGLPRA